MRPVADTTRCAFVAALGLLAASCSHAWNDYDPRLSGAGGGPSSASVGAVGGAGTGTPASGTGGSGAMAGAGGATGGGGGAPLPGSVLWSKSFGDTAQIQRGFRIAVDGSGNVIVAGDFAGTIDFGGGPLVSAGGRDVFLVKLDPDGGHVWSFRFGGALNQMARGLAVDGAGNILLAGEMAGTADFGDGPLTSAGDDDAFVAKFGPDGRIVCSASFGDLSYQAATAVQPAANDGVVFTGLFFGTITIGSPLVSAGGQDAFVARLDSTCAPVWAKSFAGLGTDNSWSMAVDASGGVFLGMDSDGTLDLGGGPLVNAGADDMFVPKLTADGAHVWSRRYGDRQIQDAAHVATDSTGALVGAGTFYGTLDVGTSTVQSGGGADVYVLKLDPNGDPVWIKGFGAAGAQNSHEVAVDAADNIVVAGYMNGAADFGGGTLTSAGDLDAFVLKLDASGNHVWSLIAGDALEQKAYGVAVDRSSGAAVVTGSFEGTIDFGAGPLTSKGGLDGFVVKLAP